MGLLLFFLPNFQEATFIQGATFIPDSRVQVGFFNLSNRYPCEPKIISEFLFPVSVNNIIWATFRVHLAKKSAFYKYHN